MIDIFGVSLNSAEIFSAENIFMLAIALFWILIASIQDLKKREVENWWNFLLVFIILAFRAFLSVEKQEIWFLAWGLIGLGFGILISNIFYYSRVFAGGDMKLLVALGTVLPLSLSWQTNLVITILFLIFLIIAGAVYGGGFTVYIMLKHFRDFKKSFYKVFKKYKKAAYLVESISILFMIFFYFIHLYLGLFLSIFLFISPLLLIHAKALEDGCMKKFVKVKDLTIGDLLANKLKVGKRIIMPYWEGLSEEELIFIQKHYRKNVLVKEGIPFVPAFFMAFIALFLVVYFGII